MKILRAVVLVAALALPVSMVVGERAYGQDGGAEATQPSPTAPTTTTEAPKPAEVTTTPEKVVTAISASEVAVDQPAWLKAVGLAWKPLLAVLLALVIAKVGASEAGKAFIRAGFVAVDMIYLAYVQPAKDPNNKEVEWDPAEARARAWKKFKQVAPPLVKLLYLWKGKEWGETMMHKFANMRSKKDKE